MNGASGNGSPAARDNGSAPPGERRTRRETGGVVSLRRVAARPPDRVGELAPRLFAIVREDADGDEGSVVGYGMRLGDGAAAFVWNGSGGGLGLFGSAGRVLALIRVSAPARLVWLGPAVEGV